MKLATNLVTLAERRRVLKLLLAALTLPAFGSAGFSQRSGVTALRVGVVLPIPTGNTAPTDNLGASAQAGAVVAEGLLGSKVLLSSAATPEAITRAAERLIEVEEVTALIGGFGQGQAELLSRIAEAAGVLFFNIGTSADEVQARAHYTKTFHLEASASTYLRALFSWFARLERRRWFFVASRSPYEGTLSRAATALLSASGSQAEVVGQALVGSGIDAYASYAAVLGELEQAQPDAVMLFMSPEDRDFFLSQVEYSGLKAPLTGFPDQLTQTREAYTKSLQSAPQMAAGYRAALWEATARVPAARALNDAFTARTGTLMESSAWAAYAALKIVTDAAQATASSEPDVLQAYLESPLAAFDVGKGTLVTFDANHQLRQQLFIVELLAGGALTTKLKDQLRLARAVGQL